MHRTPPTRPWTTGFFSILLASTCCLCGARADTAPQPAFWKALSALGQDAERATDAPDLGAQRLEAFLAWTQAVGGSPTHLKHDVQGLLMELLETLEEDYRLQAL